MHLKSWKQRFMEFVAVLFAASFVVHLMAFWLAPVIWLLPTAGLLAVVARLVWWWRNRGW